MHDCSTKIIKKFEEVKYCLLSPTDVRTLEIFSVMLHCSGVAEWVDGGHSVRLCL